MSEVILNSLINEQNSNTLKLVHRAFKKLGITKQCQNKIAKLVPLFQKPYKAINFNLLSYLFQWVAILFLSITQNSLHSRLLLRSFKIAQKIESQSQHFTESTSSNLLLISKFWIISDKTDSSFFFSGIIFTYFDCIIHYRPSWTVWVRCIGKIP